MLRELNIQHLTLPLNAPFRISRGSRNTAEVIAVDLSQDGKTGRGESVPYKHYGESVESVLEQMESVREKLCAGMGRDELQTQLPAGAARNALDNALWDLESRLTSVPVWTRLARPAHQPIITAFTISIDTPEEMGKATARISDQQKLIKIKIDGEQAVERIEAVRNAAPKARIIVDANEAWDIETLRKMEPVLVENRIDLVEQPLPAHADGDLADYSGPIPICADEACHTTSDLPRLRGLYQAVNIKLDKTGGLTEAWRLLHAARAEGFQIMVGCMLGSSLSIVPAMEVAREAAFVDLDGPFWMREDHPDGVHLRDGLIYPPSPGFWGG